MTHSPEADAHSGITPLEFRQTLGRFASGVTVITAAAGGVGLIVAQWAKLLGLTVIGTVSTEEKAAVARAHGVDGVAQVVAGALDEARIEHVADQLPSTLSSGQAQRVALASAMVRPWALLLADEPEQRLDDAGRAWLGDWLARHAATGRAVLVASHDPEVVRRSGARVVTLQGDA